MLVVFFFVCFDLFFRDTIYKKHNSPVHPAHAGEELFIPLEATIFFQGEKFPQDILLNQAREQ